MDFFNEAVRILQKIVVALGNKQTIIYCEEKSSPRPISKKTMQKHLIHHLFVPP